jgi:hypothetical protein
VVKISLISAAGSISLVLLVTPANAVTKFAPYPDREASACVAKAERDGLLVGAQPLEDARDQKAYFGTEMTPKGYLPVYIVVENKSGSDTYFFDKANVAQANASSSAVQAGRATTAEKLAMLGIGGLFTMRAITKGAGIQENLLKCEIESRTLSPGSSVHGFLYIPVPAQGQRAQILLQIPLVNARTSEVRVINLVF